MKANLNHILAGNQKGWVFGSFWHIHSKHSLKRERTENSLPRFPKIVTLRKPKTWTSRSLIFTMNTPTNL
jgi:hypothetical protein